VRSGASANHYLRDWKTGKGKDRQVKPGLMLRIAAVFTLLYCAGHTSGMPWTPSLRPQDIALIQSMKSNSYEVFGSVRTYWDSYFGFGIAISCFLAVQGVVLWFLAPFAAEGARPIRMIITAFLIAFVANSIIVWEYFFWPPLIFAVLVSVCLAITLVLLPKSKPT
jgi:hypothetical protein